MTRAVTLYERGDRLFVTPESRTVDGFWIATPIVLAIGNEGDDEAVARLVIEALEQSKEGVPTPDPSVNPAEPLLQAAGVKSFRVFLKDARSVTIQASDGVADITPMRNSGPRRGFEYLQELTQRTNLQIQALASTLAEVRKLAL